MNIYYRIGSGDSAGRGGFYVEGIHPNIPADAKRIPEDEYQALLAGQAMGKRIVADASGYPVLVDPPPPSPEQLAAGERAWRDGVLLASDGVVARHRDERDMGRPATLTDTQFSELLTYRQSLRDWPEDGEFPDASARPALPAWLAALES